MLRGLVLFAMLCLPLRGLAAAELVVWHDKGDEGIRMFEEIAAEYRRTHPDVQVRSLSFPTDQWFAKTIAGLNTNSAPDLLFNDYVRIARIQLTTRKGRGAGEPRPAALPGADAAG